MATTPRPEWRERGARDSSPPKRRNGGGSLREPLGAVGLILVVELILFFLAGTGFQWAGIVFIALVATVQAATLVLLWYVFRLLIRVYARVRALEDRRIRLGRERERPKASR